MALRRYKLRTYKTSPHTPGTVFVDRLDRPTETFKSCAAGEGSDVGDGTVRDFDYGFVIPANTLDGHNGRGNGPAPLPSTDGRDVPSDEFLPPVFPVFGLNTSRNDQITVSRGPGDVFYWGPNGKFVKESDPTKPIMCGAQIGPTKRLAGYTFRPLYPRWREGDVLVAGQEVYLSHYDGTTKVLRANNGLTLPAPYLYNAADFTVVDDYEPWLGLLSMPRTSQLLTDTLDLTGWTLASGVTVTPLAEQFIEGYPVQRVFSVDPYAYAAVSPLSFTAGQVYSVCALVRPQADKSARIVLDFEGIALQINSNKVNGQIVVSGSDARMDYRYLPGGWLYVWMRFVPVSAQTGRQLRVIPSYDAGESGTLDVAFVGMAEVDYPFWPCDGAVTSPAWSRAIVGSSPDLWITPGMDVKGSTLLGVDYHSDSVQNTGVTCGLISARDKWNSVNAVSAATTHVSYLSNELSRSNSNYSTGDPGRRNHCLSWEVGGTIDMFQSIPGYTSRTNDHTIPVGFADPADNVILLRHTNVIDPRVPVILRYCAYWNDIGLFDPETEFGPSAFGG